MIPDRIDPEVLDRIRDCLGCDRKAALHCLGLMLVDPLWHPSLVDPQTFEQLAWSAFASARQLELGMGYPDPLLDIRPRLGEVSLDAS